MKYFKVIAVGILSLSNLMAMAPARSIVGIIKSGLLPLGVRSLATVNKCDSICSDCTCPKQCRKIRWGDRLEDFKNIALFLSASSALQESAALKALAEEAASTIWKACYESQQDVARLEALIKDNNHAEKRIFCITLQKNARERAARIEAIADKFNKINH